jgi:S-methylmethionine-dependent homocysteine/selenocysteine methylase
MGKYRRHLPQLQDRLFVTDSGLETELVFQDGIELPCFAAYPLLSGDAGIERLRRYYAHYAELARRLGIGLVLEAPTWRASRDWGAQLGHNEAALADFNRIAIGLMLEIRAAYETAATKIVISGNIGPRGDGYRVEGRMSVEAAQAYHAAQIETFAHTDADLASAFTINYAEEAIGIARAAGRAGMPVVISFTLETDGRLPSGDTLAQAIERTDSESGARPAYYMINCAHPTHFDAVLRGAGRWRERIRGLRANASRRSHAELEASTELDAGDPQELGGQYRALRPWLPRMNVVGGCCGTDRRHVEAICAALAAEG